MTTKINNAQQLREEINRLKQASEFQKTVIKGSVQNFRNSLSPVNILASVVAELNKKKLFNSAVSAFEKVREFFKK